MIIGIGSSADRRTDSTALLGRLADVLPQREPELAAAAVAVRGPDAPAHRPRELGADEEPDPGPLRELGGRRRAVEQLEDPGQVVLGEARPAIEHADLDLGLGRVRHDLDGAVRPAVLRGVRDEVAQ